MLYFFSFKKKLYQPTDLLKILKKSQNQQLDQELKEHRKPEKKVDEKKST